MTDHAAEPAPQDHVDGAVLRELLYTHPAPVHIDDLHQALVDDRISAVLIDDAIVHLVRDGLAHHEGHLLIASRAAVRSEELAAVLRLQAARRWAGGTAR
jgi:hypothetical protein